jgi:hypothetical protein
MQKEELAILKILGFLLFFLHYWGLNSGLRTLGTQMLYHLSNSDSPELSYVFLFVFFFFQRIAGFFCLFVFKSFIS